MEVDDEFSEENCAVSDRKSETEMDVENNAYSSDSNGDFDFQKSATRSLEDNLFEGRSTTCGNLREIRLTSIIDQLRINNRLKGQFYFV